MADSSYIAQALAAQNLELMAWRAALLPEERLAAVRAHCAAYGRDFYTALVSEVLSVDYSEVLKVERSAVKTIMFARMYSARPEAGLAVLRGVRNA